MMQTYSNEDYLCLTDEEKLGLYFEQVVAIDKLNEDLDIAQEGLLELQKELTVKRHAVDENEKLFALAKELKEENEQLKKSIPDKDHVNQELESFKKRFEDEQAMWQDRLLALDHEKQQILSEKGYLSQLIDEYEKEIEQIKLQAATLKEQNIELQKEVEALRQEASRFNLELESSKEQKPTLPDLNPTAELQKKEEENALLRSEVGKIKVIVVQGMKEAKELKNKYLTLLQHYEESTTKQKEQENLVIALQGKLHETTHLKNRLEQEIAYKESEITRLQSEEAVRFENEIGRLEGEIDRYESEIARLQSEHQSTKEGYEKELQLSFQLLSKKVKECTLSQEKLEEIDLSYQDKIKNLISDYQDRIESFQVHIQKLTREKESIEAESLYEIQNLLDPVLEKIKGRLRAANGQHHRSGARSHAEEQPVTA